MRRNPTIFAYLALAVAADWRLLPIYWMLRMATLIPADISTYPPPLVPHHPHTGNLLNILGFSYVTSDGLLLTAAGQSRQIISGLINSSVVAICTMMAPLIIVLPLAHV